MSIQHKQQISEEPDNDVVDNASVVVPCLLERVDTLVLGGKPQSPIGRTRIGTTNPRNVTEADCLLAVVERRLGINYDNNAIDHAGTIGGRISSSRHPHQEGTHCHDNEELEWILKCVVLRSRIAGVQGDYETVLKASEKGLCILESNDNHHHGGRRGAKTQSRRNPRQQQELRASMLGYKGFALVKLGNHGEALPFLERAISLRRDTMILEPKLKKSQTSLADRRERREYSALNQALVRCYQTLGIQATPPPVIKYPRTPHLFDTGGTAATADDLVVSDTQALMTKLCNGRTQVVIEEKIDGANLGFSLCPVSGKVLVQNRSHYISSADHAQYNRINEWVAEHQSALRIILTPSSRVEKRILYGEWVVARHSIPYRKLPGYFVAFDVYDETGGKFFSRARFHNTMRGSGIPVVPVITQTTFGPCRGSRQQKCFFDTLRSMLNTRSVFRTDGGFVEGIVLRVDEEIANVPGDGTETTTAPLWMDNKWKVVRPDFVRGCQEGHWATRGIEKQQIDYNFTQTYLSECYVFATRDEGSGKGSSLSEQSETEGPEHCGIDYIKDETNSVPAKNSKQSACARKKKRAEKDFQSHLARLRRRIPRCIMLMGLPASGKSTFAKRLANSNVGEGTRSETNTWTIVNQDKMGRKECVAVAGKRGRSGRIILDRCHLTEEERSEWVGILHKPQKGELAIVYFAADGKTCIDRAAERVGHETIPHGRGERIINNLVKKLEEPTERERREVFGTVEVVRTFQESDNLLQRWGVNNITPTD